MAYSEREKNSGGLRHVTRPDKVPVTPLPTPSPPGVGVGGGGPVDVASTPSHPRGSPVVPPFDDVRPGRVGVSGDAVGPPVWSRRLISPILSSPPATSRRKVGCWCCCRCCCCRRSLICPHPGKVWCFFGPYAASPSSSPPVEPLFLKKKELNVPGMNLGLMQPSHKQKVEMQGIVRKK